MIKAGPEHKERIIEILAECFDRNKSVNWIVKQDDKRKERVKVLLDYSVDICLNSDLVFLTDDLAGVILCHSSDDRLPVLQETLLSLKLILKVTGLAGIVKAFKREKYIRSFHPREEYIYIWFIGVDKTARRRGVGGTLVKHILEISNHGKRPVYLETSVEENLAFYQHFGFELYKEAEEEIFGFPLYFLKKV